MVVGTLLGLEMVDRLDPAALDEASVVSTLRRGVIRSHEVPPTARVPGPDRAAGRGRGRGRVRAGPASDDAGRSPGPARRAASRARPALSRRTRPCTPGGLT